MPWDMAIPRRIREIRKKAGISQAALAETLGLKTHQVGDVERGVTMPSVFLIQSLVDMLGIDPAWLLCGTGEPSRKSPTTTTTRPPSAHPVRREAWFCDFCGHLLNEGWRVCPNCGLPLEWPAEIQRPADKADK